MNRENGSISIVMPAYNEERNIENTVRACDESLRGLGLRGEIVVTNDGSTDRTAEVLERLAREIPRLKVVHHRKNRGYGAALKSALDASTGSWVATIDSDGQFDVGELSAFVREAGDGVSVVTGYRRKKADTPFRVLANRGLNSLISVVFGIRLKDINCAFRLYRGELIRGLNIESRGYQAPSEIMIKLMQNGCRVREIGVRHLPREAGQSALRPLKTITETSLFLLYLKIKTVLYRRGIINSL